MVMVDGKKYDAFSSGLPNDSGQTIKIVAIKGNRIMVSPFEGEVTDAKDQPARDSDVLNRPLEELGIDLDAIDEPLSD